MTQKQLLDRRLTLKMSERLLLDEEISLLQEMIASMPHEPTQAEREEMFKEADE